MASALWKVCVARSDAYRQATDVSKFHHLRARTDGAIILFWISDAAPSFVGLTSNSPNVIAEVTSLSPRRIMRAANKHPPYC